MMQGSIASVLNQPEGFFFQEDGVEVPFFFLRKAKTLDIMCKTNTRL